MYVIDTILLSERTNLGVLSYFKETFIKEGSIVNVPFRNKKVSALVIKSRPLSDVKGEIKSQNFALKKINGVEAESFFNSAFMKTTRSISRYYKVDVETVFSSFIMKSFIKNASKKIKFERKFTDNSKNPTYIIQAPKKDRVEYYKSSVRESFAKKQSVMFIVPTQSQVEEWSDLLKKGIEQYIVRVHGSMTEKTQNSNIVKALTEKHPILIVGTPVVLSLNREDVDLIIMEEESSPYFRSINYPFIDARVFAETYAKASETKLVFGDSLLRFETISRFEEGEISEVRPILYKQNTNSVYSIVDMREEDKEKGFKVIGEELKEGIERLKDRKNIKILLFSFRSGLYSSSVCRDCGEIVSCKDCGHPLMVGVDEKENGKRIMLCGRCGKKEKSERLCSNCGSWDLLGLGITTDRIKEEMEKIVGDDFDIVVLDREKIRGKKSLENALDKINKSKKTIVISTEMGLSHLDRSFDLVAVVSYDTLFSIPLYDANEHIAHLNMELQEKTSSPIIVQTRNPENEILKSFKNRNILNLIREEIDSRKTFGYPPYKRLIKIKWKGKKDFSRQKIAESQILDQFEAKKWLKSMPKDMCELNILLRVESKDWNTKKFLDETKEMDKIEEAISSLPGDFNIEIDPSNIL